MRKPSRGSGDRKVAHGEAMGGSWRKKMQSLGSGAGTDRIGLRRGLI
jgi:hypothetical protein